MHQNTIARRNVIPNWTESENECDRFTHRDIPRMDPVEAWADCEAVSRWLSMATFQKRRERVIVTPTGDMTTDRAWARERITRLRFVAARKAA